MVVAMKFSRPKFPVSWPLVMRFGEDSAPPMPIGSPTVSASFGFGYNKKETIEKPVGVSWLNPDPIRQSAEGFWETEWNCLVFNSANVGWVFSRLVLSGTEIQFAMRTTVYERGVTTKWLFSGIESSSTSFGYDSTPNLFELQSDLTWRGKTKLCGLGFVNHWLKSALCIKPFVGSYNDVDAIRTPYYLHYGPTPSRWLCSGNYRPPKGRLKMRLPANSNLPTGTVTMRFSASPVVCIYLPGGGYKANVPKTPVIDSKLPIEPQVQRAYVMQPTIDCVRVKDNLRIVINAFSASHNRGQFAMTLSCEFSSRIDMQRTKNELLKWTINGYEFYGYIEQYTKRTVFGDETHSGTGRSRSAESASPYLNQISYTNMVNRSFAGILQELLQFTDWTVQLLGVPDFNVPARAFSASGKPPIEAVNDAIGQLGCMMICDDKNRRIKVVPRWPVVPWLTGAAQPDIVVHDAVIQEQSEADRISPLFDCVFARGEQLGVSAKVRRSGTAGDKPGADITSSLIVDVQAARLAGTAAIADSGKKRIWQLTLPVMASLPPFTIGQLIGVRVGADVFKATCDSFSLRASVDSNGAIDVSQSVGLIESLE